MSVPEENAAQPQGQEQAQPDSAPALQAEETLFAAPPAKPLRVAWLAGPETFDHIGRILQPLAVGLMDEFIGVTVFIPEKSDEHELPNVPVDVIRYSRLQWLMFQTGSLAAMADEITNRGVHLLHALDSSAAELAVRLSDATGVNYVVSCYRQGDARRLGTLGPRAVGVMAASEPIRRELLGSRVTSPDRIGLVRPGVYMVNHATCYNDKQKSITIVAGGTMDDFGAYEAVLKAFAEIKASNYDCAFFIIADGKAEERVRLAAEQMSLRSRVTFVEQQPASQLQGIFKSADIYISPVAGDHVDIASLLAMAAGDPVLAAQGHVDDVFIEGQTALMFRSGNSQELTAKLMAIVRDQAAATKLADSALSYLHEHHSAARMVAAISQIYRTAAAMPVVETADSR